MAEIRKQLGGGAQEIPVKIVNQMIFVRNETPLPLPEDDGVTLTTNYEYVPGTLCVTLNGLRQREGTEYDYVELGNNLFRFNNPLVEGDSVIVDYIKIF